MQSPQPMMLEGCSKLSNNISTGASVAPHRHQHKVAVTVWKLCSGTQNCKGTPSILLQQGTEEAVMATSSGRSLTAALSLAPNRWLHHDKGPAGQAHAPVTTLCNNLGDSLGFMPEVSTFSENSQCNLAASPAISSAATLKCSGFAHTQGFRLTEHSP